MDSDPFNVSSLLGAGMNASGRNIIRPSVFGAHQMPEPSRVPWNSGQMSWTSAASGFTTNNVVEFKGDFSLPESNKLVTKRKAQNDIPSSMAYAPIHKRLITDEHMAEHLNSLHISTDFTSHQIQPSTSDTSDTTSSSHSMDDVRSHNIPMSTKDLQRKLRNAQRITICDQLRHIQDEPLLPESLTQRIERPCTALVLWQPPLKIISPRPPSSAAVESNNNEYGAGVAESNYQDEGIEDDFELINNNSSHVDLNNSSIMDMDI